MLYPPFTALEVTSTRVEGAVVVVKLRPSLSSAVAASGLRTGHDDLQEFAEQRVKVQRHKETAKVAQEMKIRQERHRIQHEMGYQQKMARLRQSALQRKEAQLAEKLANSQHNAAHLRWELAGAKEADEEHKRDLADQMKAAKELRHSAALKLSKAEEMLASEHDQLLQALEAKSQLEHSIGRHLWNELASYVRERFRAKNRQARLFTSMTHELHLKKSLDQALKNSPKPEKKAAPKPPPKPAPEPAPAAAPAAPAPVAAPPPQDDGIDNMGMAELVPHLRDWVGPQEQWKSGKTKEDTRRVLQSCDRLLELFNQARQVEAKKERKAALDLGAFEILSSGLHKHIEEPAVLVQIFEALGAIMLKEKPKVVQDLGKQTIPAVLHGWHTVEDLFMNLVHALTKDNQGTTDYALRCGCKAEWLAEDSNAEVDPKLIGKGKK